MISLKVSYTPSIDAPLAALVENTLGVKRQVYSDSMPSKQINGQTCNNVQRNRQRLRSQMLTAQ